ncbi:MAG TPA: Ig-like domain-containing protein [Flavobacteriales bacterium]
MNKTLSIAICLLAFLQLSANAVHMKATERSSLYPNILSAQPIAEDDAYTINQGDLLEEDVSVNDTFDAADVFSLVSGVSYGTLTFNPDGTFSYQPVASFFGTDVFAYEVCNAEDGCSQALVTILVLPANPAPVASDVTLEVLMNASISGSLLSYVTDANDNAFIFTLDNGTEHGVLNLDTDGNFSYTPDEDFTGLDAFTYTVCDDEGACDSATLTFFVVNPDEFPIAQNDYFTLDEGTTFSGNAAANDSDPDGDELTYTVHTDAQHGTFVLNSDGTFTYTPDEYYYGQDTVIYSVCDPTPYCALGWIYLTILPVNSPPVANDDYVSGEQNDQISYSVAFNDMDPESDPLTYSLITDVEHGTLVFNSNGSFTYTPDTDYYGTDSFQYEVCDYELCDTATVYITIDQLIFSPIAMDDEYVINQGETLTANVATNDNMNNGGDGVYELVTEPSFGTLTFVVDGSFTYVPNAGFFGTDVFTYKVCNQNDLCDEASVTIIVNELNTVPVAVNDFFTIEEDGFLFASVAENDSDVDGDILIFTIEQNVSYGTLSFEEDGTFTYTPNLNFFGTDHFTYFVCDNDGNCDVGTVTIVVTPVNDAPVAEDDEYTTMENTQLTGFVGNNDYDVDDIVLTYQLITSTTFGDLVFNADGTFLYTPDFAFIGFDSFTYYACDDEGLCDAATVTIEVLQGPPLEVVVNIDQYTVNEDEVLYGNVSLNDQNTDGFIYSVVQGPSHGVVEMNSDGSFVYTPNQDYNGFDEFVYQACSLIGVCYEATVNIIIVPMPDDDLHIPLGFSPNNDGVNDKFVIENIESYPNNKMTIFNRWGNIVYEKSPYTAENAWDGTTDSGAVSFGDMVPEGTYFYVLETGPSVLNEGKSEKITGYIVVKYESK